MLCLQSRNASTNASFHDTCRSDTSRSSSRPSVHPVRHRKNDNESESSRLDRNTAESACVDDGADGSRNTAKRCFRFRRCRFRFAPERDDTRNRDGNSAATKACERKRGTANHHANWFENTSDFRGSLLGNLPRRARRRKRRTKK
jgi:hypothetical protein